MTDMLEAALGQAAQRWRVFPCHPTGPKAKAPLTQHGHLDATTDVDQIRAWWTRWPDAMIGAAVPQSVLVLDIDPRNGGDLAQLETVLGRLPITSTVMSGRNDGGRHLYYRRPTGPLTSKRLPAGVDLKLSGYCVVPPSIHPASGQPYRWTSDPIAYLPGHAVQQLRPDARVFASPRFTTPSGNGAAALIRAVANAPERKRNDTLYWAARRALEEGHDENIFDELADAALSTGLPIGEIARTIASAQIGHALAGTR
jgi:hypothetical protein